MLAADRSSSSGRACRFSRGATCSSEIVHSPANINLLKTFNAERYASLNIAMGQTNDVIAQAGMLIKSGHGSVRRLSRQKITLMGTSASSGTVRNYLADHATCAWPMEVRSSTAFC
jgi:hypothetical protein